MPLKAIFYDMDGTLVHFIIDYKKARLSAIQELKKHEIKDAEIIFSVEKPWTRTIKEARHYFKNKLGYSGERISSIEEEINRKIVEIEQHAALKAKKVQNIEKLLEFGKAQNIRQIIVTYNTHNVAVLTLRTVGILNFFDAIYGRDDVLKPKPNKDHLEIAAQKFGFGPESAILIGDMKSDVMAAHNFGCKAIGIRTDFEINTIDDADYVVDQEVAADAIINILKAEFNLN